MKTSKKTTATIEISGTSISAIKRAELVQTRIQSLLIEAGVSLHQAQIHAENATQPIRDIAKPPRKLTAKEILNKNIAKEAEKAESYIDALKIILKYTPQCVKLHEDLPFAEFYNVKRLQHAFIDDFQYCCAALATAKKKRIYVDVTGNFLECNDFAPDATFSKPFISMLNEQINHAVVERFTQIYLEVFGPNGLNIKGDDYFKMMNAYGIDPMDRYPDA